MFVYVYDFIYFYIFIVVFMIFYYCDLINSELINRFLYLIINCLCFNFLFCMNC